MDVHLKNSADETTQISDEALIAQFPSYAVDRDTAPRFRGWLRHEYLIDRCDSCGLLREPPGPICPKCWSTDFTRTAISGSGTIYLSIALHQGPPTPGVDYSNPYPIVTVELDEQPGLRITSTVVDAELSEIEIGKRVRLAWRERNGAPLPVFELVAEGQAQS